MTKEEAIKAKEHLVAAAQALGAAYKETSDEDFRFELYMAIVAVRIARDSCNQIIDGF